MLYLADKAGKLIPDDVVGRAKVTEWLMFQMGGIGPMMGQANVFLDTFQKNFNLLLIDIKMNRGVFLKFLDTQLSKNEWLAGEYSIADIANWCWVRTHNWSGVSLDGLTHLEKWKDKMYEQPGMIKGTKVPVDRESILKDDKDKEEFIKNAQKMVKK